MIKLRLFTIVLIASFGCVVVAETDTSKDNEVRPCVVVAGAVNMPGRFAPQRKFRVLEALAFAGGPTERADGRIQLIETGSKCFREALANKTPAPERPLKTTMLKFKDLRGADDQLNPFVNPGDVIIVVEKDPIHVFGKVAKPQRVYPGEPLTLLRAIAAAGGVTTTAKDIRVVIYRAGPDGRYAEYLRIDLNELKKNPSRDPVLHPRDILDVGPTGILAPPNWPQFDTKPPVPVPNRNGHASAGAL
jgi:protein involved in polysaccharide export with SLBB domain